MRTRNRLMLRTYLVFGICLFSCAYVFGTTSLLVTIYSNVNSRSLKNRDHLEHITRSIEETAIQHKRIAGCLREMRWNLEEVGFISLNGMYGSNCEAVIEELGYGD